MLILGLLLMAGAAAFTGLLISYNLSGGPDYTVTLLGSEPFTISTLGAFLGGIALTLIFGLGLWMVLTGVMLARRRGARHRRDEATALHSTAGHGGGTGSPREDGGTRSQRDDSGNGATREPVGHDRPAWRRSHRPRTHGG